MLYEIYDICFFVKSLKQPSTSFNITDFVSFSHNSTRSGSHLKLVHQLAKANRFNQFYFTRLPHLWNALPPMDLSKSYITIVNNTSGKNFIKITSVGMGAAKSNETR